LLGAIRRGKRGRKVTEEDEGVIYKIRCEDCDKSYIGETGKRMRVRIKQHQDDVRHRRDSNAVYKHIKETGHNIDWDRAEALDKEKRTLIRKWKEAKWIEEEGREKIMNWTTGMPINEAWNRLLKKAREDKKNGKTVVRAKNGSTSLDDRKEERRHGIGGGEEPMGNSYL